MQRGCIRAKSPVHCLYIIVHLLSSSAKKKKIMFLLQMEKTEFADVEDTPVHTTTKNRGGIQGQVWHESPCLHFVLGVHFRPGVML